MPDQPSQIRMTAAPPEATTRVPEVPGRPQNVGVTKLSTIVDAQLPNDDLRYPRRRPAWGARVLEGVFAHCPPFVAGRAITLALQAIGVRIGGATVFWGVPELVGPGDICSNLTIGTYCGFNVRSYFELDGKVTIGDHVAVGQDVMFLTRTHETSDPTRRAGKTAAAPIEVGNGVWLGARCTIMPGVKIGAGSVIGASVVVTKDVPANVLLMGTRSISLAKWR